MKLTIKRLREVIKDLPDDQEVWIRETTDDYENCRRATVAFEAVVYDDGKRMFEGTVTAGKDDKRVLGLL